MEDEGRGERKNKEEKERSRKGRKEEDKKGGLVMLVFQAKYVNGERSAKLPADNMWDNETFRQDNQ
jgi:hypothetical protein